MDVFFYGQKEKRHETAVLSPPEMEVEKKMKDVPESPAHVACDHCGQVNWFEDSMVVTKQLAGNQKITLHFCGKHCASEFYLERLRSTEGR